MPTPFHNIAVGRSLRITIILVLAFLPVGGQAQSLWTRCDWTAEHWEEQDGGVLLLAVHATCGDLTLQLDSAQITEQAAVGRGNPALVLTPSVRLEADEVTVDGEQVRARTGCIQYRRGNALRCCGQDVQLTAERWSLSAATCSIEGGLVYQSAGATGTDQGIQLTASRVLAPLGLPSPVGFLDSIGRSAGFLMPVLGFRSHRGAGMRQDWYQPLTRRADLTGGVFGETDGAVGLAATARLANHHRQASGVQWFGLFDATTEREWRTAVATDFTWESRSGHRGLSAVGELWTDAAIGRDFYPDTPGRTATDRHLTLAGWTGSDIDRLWMETQLRGLGRSPVGSTETPAVEFDGTAPAIGYAHTLSLGRLGQVGGVLAARRFEVGAEVVPSSVYSLELLAGGQAFPLSFPGIAIIPAAWVDVDNQYTEPGSSDLYYRHALRLVTGVELSSPWIGGSGEVRHYLELGASARLEIFRNTWTEGRLDEAFGFPVSQGPLLLEIRTRQAITAGSLRLDLPISWRAQPGEDPMPSLLVGELDLDWSAGGFGLQLYQQTGFDTESVLFPYWMGTLSVAFGSAASVDPQAGLGTWAARELRLGGNLLWVRSRTDLGDALRVLSLAQLQRFHLDQWRSGVRITGGWLQAQLGPVGLSGTVTWPLDFGSDPDVGVNAWIGSRLGFHLIATVDMLGDGTVIALATLAQGRYSPQGPWSVGWQDSQVPAP